MFSFPFPTTAWKSQHKFAFKRLQSFLFRLGTLLIPWISLPISCFLKYNSIPFIRILQIVGFRMKAPSGSVWDCLLIHCFVFLVSWVLWFISQFWFIFIRAVGFVCSNLVWALNKKIMRSFKNFCTKKTLIGLGLGQFLSLLITSTGFASSELAKRGTFFLVFCFLLFIVFFSIEFSCPFLFGTWGFYAL